MKVWTRKRVSPPAVGRPRTPPGPTTEPLYDYLDFGCSYGGSFTIAERLGGERGLGIDIRREKVDEARRRGIDAVVGDITALEFPRKSVRFVICAHVLEHLADRSAVELALDGAIDAAREFIYIKGPWFDADEYLARHGLKLYWSDWHGHPCHLTTGELARMLAERGLTAEWRYLRPIVDSTDDAVHPLDSPSDQHAYDAAQHPPKPHIAFTEPVYREFECIARI